MEKAAGQTTSWLNAGFVASNMRKAILRSMPISGKHERLSKAMYIPTTLSAVIQQSTIRHPHHIIIRHCWLIMMLNGCPSQLSYIYRFIIKCLNFCLDNWTTIVWNRIWNACRRRYTRTDFSRNEIFGVWTVTSCLKNWENVILNKKEMHSS